MSARDFRVKYLLGSKAVIALMKGHPDLMPGCVSTSRLISR